MKSEKARQTIFATLVLIACLFLNSACSSSSKSPEDKAQKTETRTVDTFSSLLVNGSCILDISVQEACSLSVTSGQSELAKIKTEVKDGTLQITFNDVSVATAPKISVGLPEVESIDISGACKGTMNDINSSSLKINLDGASTLLCSGTCDELTADLSGASELVANKLVCKKGILNIDGASKAKIFVKDALNLDASGAARVELLGNPPLITKNISEAASLSQGGESSD